MNCQIEELRADLRAQVALYRTIAGLALDSQELYDLRDHTREEIQFLRILLLELTQ